MAADRNHRPRISVVTLGCSKNTVDSEVLLGQLTHGKAHVVDNVDDADIVVINTCGFIEPARQESLKTLRQLGRGKRRGQLLVAAGCLAQLWGGRLGQTVPAIDGLLGTRRWTEIPQFVTELAERERRGPARPAWLDDGPAGQTSEVSETSEVWSEPALARPVNGPSAYLKIADGCSAPCAFCAIPKIKGPARSRPIEGVGREARQLVDAGNASTKSRSRP